MPAPLDDAELALETERRCALCFRMRPIEEFWTAGVSRGRALKRHQCKACMKKLRERTRPRKRVPYTRVAAFVREIVYRCGSERAAARELGLHNNHLILWRQGKVRSVERRTAAKIIVTLKRLQDEGRYSIVDRSVDNANAEYQRMRRAS